MYDIAIVGGYSWSNYGDEITYYALYWLLSKEWNKKVVMVNWTKDALWPLYREPFLFENSPYPDKALADMYDNVEDLKSLNNEADIFIVGSGQFFKPSILLTTNRLCLLEWVDSEKKKIAYSGSWGHGYIRLRQREKLRQSAAYKRFDAVSVREKSAVTLAKSEFGIDVEWVLDPVFLMHKNIYDNLIGSRYIKGKIVFGYILDPSREKEEMIQQICTTLDMPCEVITAGSKTAEETADLWSLEVESPAFLEQWLLYLRDAEYIIADSFHALCLAIIFEKQFTIIKNAARGAARFDSLVDYLDLHSRLLDETKDPVKEKLAAQLRERINYTHIRPRIERMKNHSIQWLKTHLFIFLCIAVIYAWR